uniref:DNA polymerase delta small subunit n=1 Tax=Glossina palpalis gambiensis TaxID=67801 RepID=A0A1B0BHL7_9MUSC
MPPKYENHSSKFLLKSFDYHKQFSHIYAHRLAEMSGLLAKRASMHWGKRLPIKKLCDLREDFAEECIIIGTIYKHQAHKPSILKEISEENQLAPQPPRQHYADPEDKAVCAVMGIIEEGGRFDVQDVLYYESGPQKALSLIKESKLLVLISGLEQLQSHHYPDSLNLFQHWLRGTFTSVKTQKEKVRVIVAGNSVRGVVEDKRVTAFQTRVFDSKELVNAMKALDEWFASWSSFVPLDVMPGACDPANFMIPQQPFHYCMFPLAGRYENFQCVPNPYDCSIEDIRVLGTSGQNISDLLRSTALEKPMDALRKTLIWGHLTPTAPDTLACYPYVDTDPFIIRECPHIYFAGNCDEFSTTLQKGLDGQKTRLVCVPSFAKTQSIAVVDLLTLQCHEIIFKAE